MNYNIITYKIVTFDKIFINYAYYNILIKFNYKFEFFLKIMNIKFTIIKNKN
jgi:hypothetical protein